MSNLFDSFKKLDGADVILKIDTATPHPLEKVTVEQWRKMQATWEKHPCAMCAAGVPLKRVTRRTIR